MTSPAVQRRIDATRATFDGLSTVHTSEWSEADMEIILERMRRAAFLGRTDRWKSACAYAAEVCGQPGLSRESRQTAILQGHIHMAHAID